MVPVAPQIRGVVGHDDEVKRAGGNRGVTAWADIGLAGGVRLNRRDRYPRIAHASKITTITIVPMTRAMSSGDFWARRKGLNPIGGGP